MYYKYKIESILPFNNTDCFKTIHGVTTHFFEKVNSQWKKGMTYPKFKISQIESNHIVVSSKFDWPLVEFEYRNNKVKVIDKQIVEERSWLNNEKVSFHGIISEYINKRIETKRFKQALIYSNKTNNEMILKNYLQRFGIQTQELIFNFEFIDPEMLPNNKQIHSAFRLQGFGTISNIEQVKELEYSSIGKDISYGFGSLCIEKLNEI